MNYVHHEARAFQNASGIERDAILHRFALCNDAVQGWYFPLLLADLLASGCFLATTWRDRTKGAWYTLAPVSLALGALRLLARLLSTFAGQAWLGGFNDKLYFPAVLVVDGLLLLWFFPLAHHEAP